MDTPNISSPAPESKLHFLDYWRIIRIRKTVIFAVFLLVVLTTTIVTIWLPKYYSSTVRIEVQKDMPDIPGLFDLRQTTMNFDPYFIQGEFEKITSKSVLYSVITNLNLNKIWGNAFNNGVPLKTEETYLLLQRRLDLRQVRNTPLIDIRVLSENANEAAQIANEIAAAYKGWRLQVRQESSMGGIEVLEAETKKQEDKVNELQTNVANLKEKLQISDAISDSAQSMTLETETVRRMEQARIDALAAYSQLHVLVTNLLDLSPEKLREVLPTAWPDSLLNELLSRYAQSQQEFSTLSKDYGPDNPNVLRVKSLLKTLDDQIKTKMSGMLDGLQTKALSLKGDLDVRIRELDDAKKRDQENSKIYSPYFLAKRDLEFQKQMLQALKLRLTQERVDQKLPKQAIVEVVNQAEPGEKPVRPNFPLNIALGIIVGLVVGIGLAFFIEYLDTSVKTIDDVERSLQSPVLGVIPQNVGYLLDEGPESPHAEAYRVLRTNLLFSRKDDRLNTITIVSGGAGEGKSTTVFNLATVFAQSGQRVLIVDSDLRRPSIHKFLKVSNSIGLTNYLLKQKELEEVIQTTKLPTLDFLPSGKLPSSSMGILNSARMKDFIHEVKRRYDMVFFDSPPIMGVSDASILASEVDMSVLVVQYRKYPQLMTIRAKQMVEKVGGRLMGVVLNNINISQDSYYYYYSGYYYDYYYSKRDDDAPAKTDGEAKKPQDDQAKLEIKRKY
ncbi:MAG: polysaccharide biosynthesis tyrosine autokinase [Candidatus Omnitrophica bacterium]|nr:polysaccharide biosynthesis tyrosine autokinase [Candidatus Omnitrophota bacterium]